MTSTPWRWIFCRVGEEPCDQVYSEEKQQLHMHQDLTYQTTSPYRTRKTRTCISCTKSLSFEDQVSCFIGTMREMWRPRRPIPCTMEQRYQRTQKIQYIQDKGYPVKQMWECEWGRLKKQDPELKAFVKDMQRPCGGEIKMTEDTILQTVMDEKLFGALEVDLEVPDHLNTHVSRDDIGHHMKTYATCFQKFGTTSMMPDEPEISNPKRRLWQRRRNWKAIRRMGGQWSTRSAILMFCIARSIDGQPGEEWLLVLLPKMESLGRWCLYSTIRDLRWEAYQPLTYVYSICI